MDQNCINYILDSYNNSVPISDVISELKANPDKYFCPEINVDDMYIFPRPQARQNISDVCNLTGLRSSGTPVVFNGDIIFATQLTDGTEAGIYSVDLNTMVMNWHVSPDSSGSLSGMTVYNNRLYLGTISGKLYCLNISDGSVVWSSDVIDTTPDTGLSSAPLVFNDVVYVTTGAPSGLAAFSAESGEPVSIDIGDGTGSGGAFLSSPSTDGHLVYFSGPAGISAYDPDDGIVWTFPVSGKTGTPVYRSSTVFFLSETCLYAVDAGTGQEKWNVSRSGPVVSPAVCPGTVVSVNDDGLSAYDEAGGSLLWTHAASSVYPYSPLIVGDVVFYTHDINYMSGVNLRDGTEPTILKTEIDIYPHMMYRVSGTSNYTSSPVYSDNRVFIGSNPTGKFKMAGIGEKHLTTKYLFNDKVTVPPYLTKEVSGTETAYASAAGLLSEAAGETPYVFENGSLVSYGNIENNETHKWRLTVNRALRESAFDEIQDDDVVLFYFGGSDQLTEAMYAVSIQADVAGSFAEVSVDPGYKQSFLPGETSSGKVSVSVVDWNGNPVTPPAAECDWQSSSDAFTMVKNGTEMEYAVSQTGSAGDSAVFEFVWTPENAGGHNVSVSTDPVYISERTAPIPSDEAVESTQTYFTWKGNYARTGVANGSGPLTPTILWDTEIPSIGTFIPLISGSPVVSGDRVYVTSWNGGMAPAELKVGIFCFDRETGEEIWYNPDYSGRGGITIEDGLLYTTGGLNMICLNADDGSLVWKTDAISDYPYVGLTSTPLVLNNTVYVVTTSLINNSVIDDFYGFDAQTGEQIFKMSAQSPDGKAGGIGIFASVSMSPDGILYVPGGGGMFAFDPATKTKLWEFDCGARSTKSGKIDGNNVYVGSPVYKDQCVYFIRGGNGDIPTTLFCMDAITGKEVRSFDITSAPVTPVITDDKIITLAGGAHAYDLETGEELWFLETDGSNRASPIVAGNAVYFGTYTQGLLYAVDIDTGKEIWQYKLPSPPTAGEGWFNIVEGTPAIEDGVLYIGAENGHFYAFKDPEAPGTFTITAAPSRNGVIRPAGDTAVEAGGSVVCTITPDSGWHIVDVLVDGVSVGAVSSYRFSNVDADHTIAAVYEKDGTQPKPTRDTVRELIAYLANGDPLREDYNYDFNNDFRINGKDLILAEMMSA